MRLQAKRGRGYVLAEGNKNDDQPIGVLPIDSIYTPVARVNYQVENTRVGQVTATLAVNHLKKYKRSWANLASGFAMKNKE